MNVKIIIAAVIVVVFIVFGAISFLDSNVEYTDFSKAQKMGKKVQVKGYWMKDKQSDFDPQKGQFTFFMKDDSQKVVKVVLEGAKPNNFEIATSVVAKGRYKNDHFHATEILTKCPSKYDGDSSAMKKTL